MPDYSETKSDVRQGGVATALSQLHSTSEKMAHVAAMIEERIEPVLRPLPANPGRAESPSAGTQDLSNVADNITQIGREMEHTLERLQSLDRRIDL